VFYKTINTLVVRNLLMVEKVLLRRNDLAAAIIVFLYQPFRNLFIDGINV